MTTTATRDLPLWVLVGAGLAVVWRITALAWPSPYIELPDTVRFPTSLLGLLFLCAGVITLNRASSRWALVFATYCLGSAIHWGGAIGLPGAELELLFVYLAFTVAADAAFLHLALIYPTGKITLPWYLLLYAPAVMTLLVAPFARLLAASSSESLIGIALIIGNALSMVGALGFIIRAARLDANLRGQSGILYIAAAVIISGMIQILGSGGYFFGEPEAWNLALVTIPLVIAVVLMSQPVPARD